MGIDFLAVYGACRVRNYEVQPLLLSDGLEMVDNPDNAPQVADLSIEQAAAAWQPVDVRRTPPPRPWPFRPLRFVDGKDVGRTVAWLQSQEVYPVPVRLSEIGAVIMREVVMRDVGRQLRRELGVVEKADGLRYCPFSRKRLKAGVHLSVEFRDS